MRGQTLSRLMNTGAYLITGGVAALTLGNSPAYSVTDPPVTFEYNLCKDGVFPKERHSPVCDWKNQVRKAVIPVG
jgi:hypothetical protein